MGDVTLGFLDRCHDAIPVPIFPIRKENQGQEPFRDRLRLEESRQVAMSYLEVRINVDCENVALYNVTVTPGGRATLDNT